MARINIEDTFWSYDPFLALVEKLGNRASAVGAVILAFKLAQKYWVPDQRPIPSVKFRSLPFASDLIECGIASESEDGDFVHVHGAKDQFEWLIQRSQAGAKSKEKKANGTNRNKTKRNGSQRNETSYSSSYSSSPSSSSSGSNSNSEIYSVGQSENSSQPSGGKSPSAPSSTQVFIARYCELFKARWKTNPEIRGKEAGIAKRLVSDLGVERACELLEAFFEMNDAQFLRAKHALGVFEVNLQSVVVKADTGRVVTFADARNAEASEYHANQLDRIRRGEL